MVEFGLIFAPEFGLLVSLIIYSLWRANCSVHRINDKISIIFYYETREVYLWIKGM